MTPRAWLRRPAREARATSAAPRLWPPRPLHARLSPAARRARSRPASGGHPPEIGPERPDRTTFLAPPPSEQPQVLRRQLDQQLARVPRLGRERPQRPVAPAQQQLVALAQVHRGLD